MNTFLIILVLLAVLAVGLDQLFHFIPRKKKIRHFSHYENFKVRSNGIIDMMPTDVKEVHIPIDTKA